MFPAKYLRLTTLNFVNDAVFVKIPQLMKLHAVHRDLLPPKRYHGNLSKQLIDQRRLQLETYLHRLIHRYGMLYMSKNLENLSSLSLSLPPLSLVKQGYPSQLNSKPFSMCLLT